MALPLTGFAFVELVDQNWPLSVVCLVGEITASGPHLAHEALTFPWRIRPGHAPARHHRIGPCGVTIQPGTPIPIINSDTILTVG